MSSFINIITINDIPECLLWEVLVGVWSSNFVSHNISWDTEALLPITPCYFSFTNDEFSQNSET